MLTLSLLFDPGCICGSITQASTLQAWRARRVSVVGLFANTCELKPVTSKGKILIRGKSHNHSTNKCILSWPLVALQKLCWTANCQTRIKCDQVQSFVWWKGNGFLAEWFSIQDSSAPRGWNWTECRVMCIWWSLCHWHSHQINVFMGNPDAVL